MGQYYHILITRQGEHRSASGRQEKRKPPSFGQTPSQAAAATILGTARELTGKERTEGQKLYVAKHPHLTDFSAEPGCALFQVTIEHIYLVTRFQEVMQFDFPTCPQAK
jgi:hypothetical protein